MNENAGVSRAAGPMEEELAEIGGQNVAATVE